MHHIWVAHRAETTELQNHLAQQQNFFKSSTLQSDSAMPGNDF